jgi:hypothetical protein
MTCAIIVTGHSNPLGMTGIDPACYPSLLVLFEQFLCLLNLLLCLVLYFCGIFIDICDVQTIRNHGKQECCSSRKLNKLLDR